MSFLIYIARLLLNLIYFFMKLQRPRKKIVFLSRQSDKPSIDFSLLENEIKKEHPDYETVLLCKQIKGGIKGKLDYIFHIFVQMNNISTAEAIILDSYCIPASLLKHRTSLVVIQIWHALGNMKRFGYALLDKPEGSSSKLAKAMRMHKNYDFAVISSLSFKDDFTAGFNISDDMLAEIPLPKTDLLIDRSFALQMRKSIFEKYPLLEGKKNILYCPTFRKDSKGEAEALQRLADSVDKAEYNLILSCHPVSSLSESPSDVFKLDASTFELLFIADFVISDYSTVFYEAGLLNLPIFSYAYDWDEYSEKRQMNFDIANDFPGLFTSDPKEIIYNIENEIFDYDKLSDFINKNISVGEGNCTKRLAQFIFKQIKIKK